MVQQRPSMHARDSSGKQVSLLNNDDPQPRRSRLQDRNDGSHNMARSGSNNTVGSMQSAPSTPALERTDSYDSRTHEPSPVTPTSPREYGRPSSYMTADAGYKQEPPYDRSAFDDFSATRQSQYPGAPLAHMGSPYEDRRRSLPNQALSMYDENGYAYGGASTDRGTSGKRYPCRYRDSHGCEKTFTTSGHASRHSKIHTAEKGVSCTFEGCPKKFTRADNMKQHLDTHYKDKARAKSGLTRSSGVQKPSRPASRAENHVLADAALRAVDAAFAQFAPYLPHMASQAAKPTMPYQPRTQPHPIPREMDGLDVLAAAASHQA